jgi:predicted Zn-dependent protease
MRGLTRFTCGLIAVLDHESQLAGVLAHEMSHVALRHGTTPGPRTRLHVEHSFGEVLGSVRL